MSNQDSEPFSIFSKKPKFSSQPQPDTFYNGFGGHSKSDNYPSAKKEIGLTFFKKPKGVAKPKVESDPKMKTINKYFNFDTP